jgi:hypothetical protein
MTSTVGSVRAIAIEEFLATEVREAKLTALTIRTMTFS